MNLALFVYKLCGCGLVIIVTIGQQCKDVNLKKNLVNFKWPGLSLKKPLLFALKILTDMVFVISMGMSHDQSNATQAGERLMRAHGSSRFRAGFLHFMLSSN